MTMVDKANSSVRANLLKMLPTKQGHEKVEVLAKLTEVFRELAPLKAEEFGKQALSLLRVHEDNELSMQILNNLIWTHQHLGQYAKALEYSLNYFELASASSNLKEKSNALNRIGGTYYRMSRFNEALNYFHKAIKISEELNDVNSCASLYSNIGVISAKIGDKDKALEYYNRAIKVLEDTNERSKLASVYNNAGAVYGDDFKHKKAVEYHRKALEIREQLGEKMKISHSLSNIASELMSLENYTNSLDHNFKALIIQQETGDRHTSAVTLLNIGHTYTLLNKYDDALKHFQQAQVILEKLEAPDLEIESYNYLAKLFEKRNEPKNALDCYKQLKTLSDEMFSQASRHKYHELQVNFDSENKVKENKIYRLRNIELAEANEKLAKAITEVKTLSGLLPICSSCKKIRDDSGYWGQIERYISDRTDTQFSHCVCPECLEKLYPELKDETF